MTNTILGIIFRRDPMQGQGLTAQAVRFTVKTTSGNLGGGRRKDPGPGAWRRREDRNCSQDSVECEAFLWALSPSLFPPFHFAALLVTSPGRAALKRLHICKKWNGDLFSG